MSEPKLSRLRFNFGFLLEAPAGTFREIELDYPEIKLSADVTLTPLQGTIRASRTMQGVYVKGTLVGRMDETCMRCLEPFRAEVAIELGEHFHYPASEAGEGEYTVNESGNVDLAPLVREIALLEVPIKPVCRDDCQGLCMSCGQNLNEADCGCTDDSIDPRFAALQQLLDDEGA